MGNKLAEKWRFWQENGRDVILQSSRSLWRRFPEAVLLNFLHLLYQGHFLMTNALEDMDKDDILWTVRLLTWMLAAVAAVLWFERRPDLRLGRFRWPIWCVAAAMGAVFEACPRILPSPECVLFYPAVLGALVCLVLYLLLPREAMRQSVQLREVMNAVGTAVAMGGLLMILGGICFAAVQALLMPLSTEFRVLVLGLVPFTCAIHVGLCLLPPVTEKIAQDDAFRSGVITRMVFPCCAVMLVILYLYIGKIIVLRNMPEGAMNWYASLALLAYGCFYLLGSDIRQGWFARFLRWGLFLFLPILIVQFYGIWLRYEAYGLTTLRYMSMVCTGFGILLLCFGFLRRGGRPLFLVAAGLLLVFSLTPLNVVRVPLYNQQARLIRLLTQEGLYVDGRIVMTHAVSAERAAAVQSCVDYIGDNMLSETDDFSKAVQAVPWRNYLPQTARQKARVPEMAQDEVTFYPRRKGVPVEGFRRLYPFVIKENGAFVQMDEGKTRTLDLMAYAERLMADQQGNHGKRQVFLDERYVVDDQTALYFTALKVQRGPDGRVAGISGKGYMLQK